MAEQEDPVQLRLWYWELNKKQKTGDFSHEDTFMLIYVCTELGRLGYSLNEDESDWILPSDPPRKGDYS